VSLPAPSASSTALVARRTLAAAVIVAGAILAGGCGEKQEPDLSQIPPPPQPQPPTPPKALPPAVVGRWHGTLHQKGLKPFEVRVGIVSATDRDRNVVHYTGIDCSGTWLYLDAEGPDVHFRELIDRGAGGNCKGAGDVTVTPLAGEPPRLRYEFRGAGIESTGVLQPAGG
jgi:hypothetical protein